MNAMYMVYYGNTYAVAREEGSEQNNTMHGPTFQVGRNPHNGNGIADEQHRYAWR